LNYANEPRYGVLRDLADRIVRHEPIDLTTGYVNVIWQRDANSVAWRAFAHCTTPPFVLNVTGREIVRVRALAERLGAALGVAPIFQGKEADTALLSDASRCETIFGAPETTLDEMMDRVAAGVRQDGRGLGKPTHFEERQGAF
jgi:hypothetical protein